jgi:hypothetical protein
LGGEAGVGEELGGGEAGGGGVAGVGEFEEGEDLGVVLGEELELLGEEVGAELAMGGVGVGGEELFGFFFGEVEFGEEVVEVGGGVLEGFGVGTEGGGGGGSGGCGHGRSPLVGWWRWMERGTSGQWSVVGLVCAGPRSLFSEEEYIGRERGCKENVCILFGYEFVAGREWPTDRHRWFGMGVWGGFSVCTGREAGWGIRGAARFAERQC